MWLFQGDVWWKAIILYRWYVIIFLVQPNHTKPSCEGGKLVFQVMFVVQLLAVLSCFSVKEHLPHQSNSIHPGRLTWNLKITQLGKENHLPNLPSFSGSMLIFQGVVKYGFERGKLRSAITHHVSYVSNAPVVAPMGIPGKRWIQGTTSKGTNCYCCGC